MNALDLALQSTIDEHVHALMKDEDPNLNRLLPPAARQKKLESELKASLNLGELQEHITLALRIFKEEGRNYLSEDEFHALLENLDVLRSQLENLDLTQLEKSLKAALQIPSGIKALMLKMGVAKFEEDHLADSLAVFNFLVSLDNEDPNYWYRLGLVAQEIERFELALAAFGTTLQLAPEFMGASVFKAQCYFSNNQYDLALKELDEVKNKLKTSKNNEKWNHYIVHLENLINKH